MPFETYSVSSYEAGPIGPRPKDPNIFADEITSVYERVKNLGGEVISHEVVGLGASFEASNGNRIGKIDPVDHAVIVARLPQ